MPFIILQLKKLINFRQFAFGLVFTFLIDAGQLFSLRKVIILSVLFLYFSYCFSASFFFIRFLTLASQSYLFDACFEEQIEDGVHILRVNFYLSLLFILYYITVLTNIELFFLMIIGSVEDIAHKVFSFGLCILASFRSGDGSDSSRSRSLLRLCLLFYELFLLCNLYFYFYCKKFLKVVLGLFSCILFESFRMLLRRQGSQIGVISKEFQSNKSLFARSSIFI